MKIKFNSICFFAIIISSLISCKTNLKLSDNYAGSADFSRYVAIGNSLTSGYADGALSKSGQLNSFPVMLSQQFSVVGGGSFKVPYMSEGAGNDGNGNPRRVLDYVVPCGSTSTTLSPMFDPSGASGFTNVSAQGPYNLIGVPGARAVDANNPIYGYLNPYLQRICSNLGTSTMLSEALRMNPTFFTLWMGTNDALLYATGGAVYSTNIFNPALTDTTQVRIAITELLDSLTKNGAKGAIANIPDITSIPFFTTIPWNCVELTQEEANNFNILYNSLGLSNITWNVGYNGLVIVDSLSPGYMRHANSNDFILLTTPGDSIRCGKWGCDPSKPLLDQYVLDQVEANEIQSYIAQYNISIANLASQKGLALVNMNEYLKHFKSGIVYNGISMNASFVSGGGFSLDGVHPGPRGYALIANEFIKAINTTYGAQIPLVDATKYHSVIFPK